MGRCMAACEREHGTSNDCAYSSESELPCDAPIPVSSDQDNEAGGKTHDRPEDDHTWETPARAASDVPQHVGGHGGDPCGHCPGRALIPGKGWRFPAKQGWTVTTAV